MNIIIINPAYRQNRGSYTCFWIRFFVVACLLFSQVGDVQGYPYGPTQSYIEKSREKSVGVAPPPPPPHPQRLFFFWFGAASRPACYSKTTLLKTILPTPLFYTMNLKYDISFIEFTIISLQFCDTSVRFCRVATKK